MFKILNRSRAERAKKDAPWLMISLGFHGVVLTILVLMGEVPIGWDAPGEIRAGIGSMFGDPGGGGGGEGERVIYIEISDFPTAAERAIPRPVPPPPEEPEPPPAPLDPPASPTPTPDLGLGANTNGNGGAGPGTGPGSGGGAGGGVGAGIGSGVGPGTGGGGGPDAIQPPVPIGIFIPPDPPASVRGKTVDVRLAVDTRGLVTDAEVIPSTGDRSYDARLARTAREWRFRPARRADGQAVSATFDFSFAF